MVVLLKGKPCKLLSLSISSRTKILFTMCISRYVSLPLFAPTVSTSVSSVTLITYVFKDLITYVFKDVVLNELQSVIERTD